MLSETDIHYVTGFLYVLTRREDVSIVLGEKVFDEASESRRDVDIAIATAGEHGLAGIEVKDEGRPLHVGLVEGICQKFADMPSITRRSIVSASGYTAPALRKAAAHGVQCLRIVRGKLPPFATIDLSQVTEIPVSYLEWREGPNVALQPNAHLSETQRSEICELATVLPQFGNEPSQTAARQTGKVSPSLRALAIRQKKIHIVGTPEIVIEGTPVYLDVEGLPDRDFYYLIGVRIGDHDSAAQHSLWADSIEDERRIWNEFTGILANVRDPVLIHYGGYETVFLKRMADRYGLPPVESRVANAVKKSVNLLSVIFAQVYFPTLSNRLKEIGHFLGAKWTGPVTSGLQSLAYRLEWEHSLAPDLKAALATYNRDDCVAIETVTSHLIQIIGEAKSRTDVEFPDNPKKVASGKGAEIHGSFESILRSAHFRYAHFRVKLSTEKVTQSPLPEKKKPKRRQQRRSFSTIKGIIIRVPRKRICPAGHKLSASSKTSQHSLLDLTFSKSGCHKTIVRYTGLMGYCKLCHEKYAPLGTRLYRGQRFGWKFQAWVVYQRIALRMSYRLISKAIYDLFSEPLSPETAVGFVERFSEYYQRTEDLLLCDLLNGPVVHLDETKINILGADQYVWVLTHNARVVFKLRPNRETEFLKPLFSTFKGTVVSDFYGGYDALPCRQQKCLVHLIRDLNDDLWKNPFDNELEGFVAAVRDLLVPILEDVQRFGLKARHLRKHRSRVDCFYRDMVKGQASVHDTTARFRKRFERYKESLFSFIENDGVPWHNNAAERALRHLAVQRKISGAFSEKGAHEYLRLLAIAQTCRFQRKSFLGFLLSKSTNVDEYRNQSRVHPDWATNPWEK